MDSYLNQEQYKDVNFTTFNKVPVMLTNFIRKEKFKKKKRGKQNCHYCKVI